MKISHHIIQICILKIQSINVGKVSYHRLIRINADLFGRKKCINFQTDFFIRANF